MNAPLLNHHGGFNYDTWRRELLQRYPSQVLSDRYEGDLSDLSDNEDDNMTGFSDQLIADWKTELTKGIRDDPSTKQECPNYWHHDPSTLVTTSHPQSFTLGTGSSIFALDGPILPQLLT